MADQDLQWMFQSAILGASALEQKAFVELPLADESEFKPEQQTM